MTKDYYQILDIPEFSSQDEIKSAYRKLARKFHPDIAGNTPDILARFKEINEAYEILSNRTSKADYDTARRFYSYAKNGAQTQNKTKNNATDTTRADKNEYKETYTSKKTEVKNDKKGFGFNWEEFISKKCREAQYKKEQKAKAPKRGEDIFSDIEISVFEAASGTIKTVNMLQTHACPNCAGRKFVNGAFCSHCNGKGTVTEYKKFNVKIPAGVKNNSKIRLAGEGEKGINGGINGDLYIIIHIKEPVSYKTEGLNILKTIAISPYEAVLGATIQVPTIQGNVNVKIAPNTQNGRKIRLSGCGIEQKDKIGDMIITVEIQIPANLTNEEIELYKKLQEISSQSVR